LPTDTNYPKAGSHTLFIFADGHAIYSKDFTVIERIIAPNLEVRSFSTAPVTNVHIGANVTLTAYIRNVGLADASNSTVRFYVNEELLKELPADIAQQITTPFKASWTPTAAGDYILKVVAYASGDVYTDNNEYSMNITVTNSTA
jgi:subtilase family serine protease